MLIAKAFPGLGGPHDVIRLPMRYFRRLRRYIVWEAEMRVKAMEKPKDPEVEELEKAAWESEKVTTNEPR